MALQLVLWTHSLRSRCDPKIERTLERAAPPMRRARISQTPRWSRRAEQNGHDRTKAQAQCGACPAGGVTRPAVPVSLRSTRQSTRVGPSPRRRPMRGVSTSSVGIWEPRGKNGKDQRSFAFAQSFGHGWIPLNHAASANTSELTRTAAPDRQAGGHWFEPSTAHLRRPWKQGLFVFHSNGEAARKRLRVRIVVRIRRQDVFTHRGHRRPRPSS
jgi:hypothetical protein